MNYVKIRDNLVAVKIKTFGKAVSLRRPGSTSGWTKGWDAGTNRAKWTLNISPFTVVYVDPAGTPIDVTGNAIEKTYQQREINGTTVLANDRLFLTIDIPTPTVADKLIVGTSILTIVSAVAIQPGDVTLVWKLQCRGV